MACLARLLLAHIHSGGPCQLRELGQDGQNGAVK